MKKRLFFLLMAALLTPFISNAQYNASVHIDTTIYVCEEYHWPVSDSTYTASGVHFAIKGDTLYILDLIVTPHYNVVVSEPVDGGCSFVWGDTTITNSGVYTRTFPTANNCDSTVTITLVISPVATKSYEVTACGEYTWKGNTYNTTQVVEYLDQSNVSCDSNLTLNLTIIQPEQKSYDTVVTACEKARFRFHPTLSMSDFYTDTTITSEAFGNTALGRTIMHPRTLEKCYDSLVSVQFIIKKNFVQSVVLDTCDSYKIIVGDSTYRYQFTKKDSIYCGKAANGCDSSISLDLTIYKSPKVYISGDLRVKDGEKANLQANADQDVVYTWDDGSHDVTRTTPVLHENLDVSLTGVNNTTHCSNTSIVTIMVTTVGIDETLENNIQVYPNPTAYQVNINSAVPVSRVTVFNTVGQQVMNIENASVVDMHNFANGTYLLRIEMQDGTVSTRNVILKK